MYRMGPRLPAAPPLAPRPGAREDAERVLPRARLLHLPGRPHRVPAQGPHEHRTHDVGERLSAQRLDVGPGRRTCCASRRPASRRRRRTSCCTRTWPGSTASTRAGFAPPPDLPSGGRAPPGCVVRRWIPSSGSRPPPARRGGALVPDSSSRPTCRPVRGNPPGGIGRRARGAVRMEAGPRQSSPDTRELVLAPVSGSGGCAARAQPSRTTPLSRRRPMRSAP